MPSAGLSLLSMAPTQPPGIGRLNGCFTFNLIKHVHESHYALRDKSSRAKYTRARVRAHDHQCVVRGRSCQRRTRDPLVGERAVSGTPCPSRRDKNLFRVGSQGASVLSRTYHGGPPAPTLSIPCRCYEHKRVKQPFFSSGPQCGESLPSWKGEEGIVRAKEIFS